MFYFKCLFSPNASYLLPVSVLTLSVLSCCHSYSLAPTAEQATSPKSAQNRPVTVHAPEANIIVDEAMLAKPYAIIGGAVENIGSQKLDKLSVEIELRRRADGS